MTSESGDCASYAFKGVGSDAEADLAICLREDGGLDTVNGNIMDHDGGEYEIASTAEGGHLWFVIDLKKLDSLSQVLHQDDHVSNT